MATRTNRPRSNRAKIGTAERYDPSTARAGGSARGERTAPHDESRARVPGRARHPGGTGREREPESRLQAVMDDQEPARKNEARKDLVRAIFGKDAVAEDTVR